MSFSPAALFNSYFLTVLKRETGESPVRSRHCKPGAHDLSLELGEQSLIGFPVGKAVMREERQARKPAGCWYGNSKDADHEELIVPVSGVFGTACFRMR